MPADRMEVKKWLHQYRDALQEAVECIERLDEADIVIKSPRMDGMPQAAASGDNVERLAILRVTLEARANRARDKALRLADEINDAIDGLANSDQRRVLRLRYISGYCWEQVAISMHMSLRTVHRVHGQALNELRRARGE